MTPSDLARIAARTTPDGDCRLWTGPATDVPRIHVTVDGKPKKCLVRRLVWEHHHGSIPKGKVLIAICNERACVNGKHLRLVTKGEAMRNGPHFAKRSVTHKMRISASLRKRWAKLTPEQARAVFESTKPSRETAKEFGISHGLVNKIRSGKIWKNYTGLWAGLGAR